MTNQRNSKPTLLSTILAAIIVIIAAVISLVGDGTPQNPDNNLTTPTVGVTEVAGVAGSPTLLTLPQGFGARLGFWQVYFTAPTGSRDPATYIGGIDSPLATAIGSARGTIDIAAFEFNDPLLTQAVLDADGRGIHVRMVTDDEHGREDEDSTIGQLIEAGIPVVDDQRSALMHNKFVIIDSTTVWTGSMNLTVNGVYRNNNNLIALRSRRAVEAYQEEFNEMFDSREFGPRSTTGNGVNFRQDGVSVQVLFAPEDEVLPVIFEQLNQAEASIRFMSFSFTVDAIAHVIQEKAADGVMVQGIFETTGSETRFSELTPLFCAGLSVRQDGNPFILHHKVFIVDDDTVLTGSFNFSDSATRSNDENMVIIQDRNLAAQYLAEFERRWAEASTPEGLVCS